MPSGRVYNIGFGDPKVPVREKILTQSTVIRFFNFWKGRGDITGELLGANVLKIQMEIYRHKTAAVVEINRKMGVLR